MSETVFILGAGASMHAGAPGMMNFLDVADRLRRTKRVKDGPIGDAFDIVMRGRAALDPIFAKAWLDADNLESVFGAFEMADLFGQLGNFDAAVLHRLPAAMRTVIVETLEQTVEFPIRSASTAVPSPTQEYDRFAAMLTGFAGDAQGHLPVSVITFNYDVALDHALFHRRFDIDYCLSNEPASTAGNRSRIDLMKLHGSVNWTTCTRCHVIPFRLEAYMKGRRWDGVGTTSLNFSSAFTERFQHDCPGGGECDRAPVIVPPTWDKSTGHRSLSNVWRRAARHLSEARNIIVAGYSLPETDQFFRYLYALGTVSATRLERFILANPDDEVEKRFLKLLGGGVQRRFEYRKIEFGSGAFQWFEHLLLPAKGTAQ